VDKVAAVASGTDQELAGIVGALLGGTWIGRSGGIDRRCRSLELQEETGLGGALAFGGMPQTEIADFVQALGKNVLEKAANELVTIDTAGPPTG
jgi:hypothetical protein